MKKILLTATLLLGVSFAHSQNINDNKVNFKYIQLPLIKIDDQFTNYQILVEHDYNQANIDSLALFQARKDLAVTDFERQIVLYQASRDSLDKIYLGKLATWEKNVNAGLLKPDGTQIDKPSPPNYPIQPAYPNVEAPHLHTEFTDANVNQKIALSGFEDGLGGIQITIKLKPIQNISIVKTKKGTGTATKYLYSARYTLPVAVTIASPTQGILLETTMFTSPKTYKMTDQKSQYDHQIYMLDHKDEFYNKLELYARNAALAETNNYLNNQFGYVNKTRSTEIYSVKSFKNYDYTDVTQAYTLAVQALQVVGSDRDRDGAMDQLDGAIDAIKLILEESSLSDKKTRINPKVTAMLQCNLAELLAWQGEYDKAGATVNIAKNSGEGKAKRHCNGVTSFYADQRKRWDVHY
ncbi:MAG: hypothetical protein ACJASQ_001440 [Crocinitomicaceae bacterium]|jgi:hypothetical protein